MEDFKAIIKSQYRAALEMVHECILHCEDELWYDKSYTNPTWRITYHALYTFRLYLYQRLEDYVPWQHHRKGLQYLSEDLKTTDMEPYSRKEMEDFLALCLEMISTVDQLKVDHPESGFHWYTCSKAEHLIVNLRHLQHHTGQLQDRIRNRQKEGISWVKVGTAKS